MILFKFGFLFECIGHGVKAIERCGTAGMRIRLRRKFTRLQAVGAIVFGVLSGVYIWKPLIQENIRNLELKSDEHDTKVIILHILHT